MSNCVFPCCFVERSETRVTSASLTRCQEEHGDYLLSPFNTLMLVCTSCFTFKFFSFFVVKKNVCLKKKMYTLHLTYRIQILTQVKHQRAESAFWVVPVLQWCVTAFIGHKHSRPHRHHVCVMLRFVWFCF